MLAHSGGNKWTRTTEPKGLCEVALFPECLRILVGTSGLEPPTSRLSGVCSNQLSYVPIYFVSNGLSVTSTIQRVAVGGGKRVRTADPLLARQVLSQLSYTPKKVRLGLTENKCPDETEHNLLKTNRGNITSNYSTCICID